MQISDLGFETRADRARLIARVAWEDSDRPSRELYIETPSVFASCLSRDATPFLLAALIPALHHGEARIKVDLALCPVLHNGLIEAMSWIRHWFLPHRELVHIEASSKCDAQRSLDERVAGSFLSGGLDSLATLRLNRLRVPLSHPASIRACLFVYGFDIGWGPNAPDGADTFERAYSSLQPAVSDAGVELIPVYSNIRHLDDDTVFWMHEFHGAALASVAHAFAGKFHTVRIASSFDIPGDRPWATRPVLDRCYGSFDLKMDHDGIVYTRLEKAGIISGWEAGLQSLRVCTYNPKGALNCGQCDKCVRTMLQLIAKRGLERCSAFPARDLSRDSIAHIRITSAVQAHYYRDLIPALTAVQRQDLSGIIMQKLRGYQWFRIRRASSSWKEWVKTADRRWFKGRIRSWVRKPT